MGMLGSVGWCLCMPNSQYSYLHWSGSLSWPAGQSAGPLQGCLTEWPAQTARSDWLVPVLINYSSLTYCCLDITIVKMLKIVWGKCHHGEQNYYFAHIYYFVSAFYHHSVEEEFLRLCYDFRYINGTRLDDRIIRTDWDSGFEEGRQYGLGESGGQVRE